MLRYAGRSALQRRRERHAASGAAAAPGGLRRARPIVLSEFARWLKPRGRLVLIDSLQRGDEPDYDGLLELFPQSFHEPYYTSYIEEDFGAIGRTFGLTHTRDTKAFVSKVMVFD